MPSTQKIWVWPPETSRAANGMAGLDAATPSINSQTGLERNGLVAQDSPLSRTGMDAHGSDVDVPTAYM